MPEPSTDSCAVHCPALLRSLRSPVTNFVRQSTPRRTPCQSSALLLPFPRQILERSADFLPESRTPPRDSHSLGSIAARRTREPVELLLLLGRQRGEKVAIPGQLFASDCSCRIRREEADELARLFEFHVGP